MSTFELRIGLRRPFDWVPPLPPPPEPSNGDLPTPDPLLHKFISTTGDDGNAGTEAAPWRTIEFAVTQLAAGDVLWIRGNADMEHPDSFYHVTGNPDIAANGTEENPIIIASYPGENPLLYRGITDFLATGQSNWELFDAATGTYRTVATYPSDTAIGGGRLIDSNGEEWRLLPYDDTSGAIPPATEGDGLANLMSTDPIVYAGPGVAFKDSRIYIRLQQDQRQSTYFAAFWPTGWPAGSKDPNDYKIRWSQGTGGASRRCFGVFRGTQEDVWIELHNLNIYAGLRAGEITNARNFRVIGGKLLAHGGWRVDGSQNWLVSHVHFAHRLPPWVCWDDDKRTRTMAINGPVFQHYSCHNGTIQHCWAEHCWTAFFHGGGFQSNIKVLHNFLDHTHDDAVDLNCGMHGVEVAYNYIITGTGVSWRSSSQNAVPGDVYVHDNVIDAAGRVMMEWTARHGIPFGTHSVTGSPRVMRQIYQNTIVGAISSSYGLRVGYQFGFEAGDPMHSAYNNILHQAIDGTVISRYHKFAAPQQWRGDGNVYYRPGTGNFVIGVTGLSQSSYTPAQFNTYKSDTAAFGSEQASLFGDTEFINVPGTPSGATIAETLAGCFDTVNLDYRPNSAGLATQTGVDLTAIAHEPNPWPDAGNPGYAGALDPNSADKWQGIGGFYLEQIVAGNIPPAITMPGP